MKTLEEYGRFREKNGTVGHRIRYGFLFRCSHSLTQSFLFFLLFFSLLWGNRNSYALENLRFMNLVPENGLSSGNVLCFLQDYTGYMWIGTAEGLNRYDGRQFKPYQHVRGDTSSLSGNYINTLLEDSGKNLWIGLNNGLCRYNRDLDRFDRIDFATDNSPSFTYNVSFLFEDRQKRLWIGTNHGAFFFDRENDKFLPFQEKWIEGGEITQIGADSAGNLLISVNDKGLFLFDISGNWIERYHSGHPLFSTRENNIIAFALDREDRIWLGYYSQGAAVIDRSAKTITHFQHSDTDENSLLSNQVSTL
ncbi:MAG TPA: two-component regulator propeller domain-containing protein, partial [Prolixibacteraceae bacterium]|nr:two-component regulator propeller domain-containing protein [Prolixibacteraceae bacterium]